MERRFNRNSSLPPVASECKLGPSAASGQQKKIIERRFNSKLTSQSKLGSTTPTLQTKKRVGSRQQTKPPAEQVPDLTDFMNDMFFGTTPEEKKAYNLTGRKSFGSDDWDGFDDSVRSNSSTTSNSSSRLTHEWLEEAKRMVAMSPARQSAVDSSSKLVGVGSPRFASSQGSASPSASLTDRRDPLSRSARRHRAVEGFTEEILSKSGRHSRSNSEIFDQPPPTGDASPATGVQRWFANIIKNPKQPPPPPSPSRPSAATPIAPKQKPAVPPLPPSTPRKSRFQNSNPTAATQPQGIPTPLPKRTFKTATSTQVLSPPKQLVESGHRKSFSSATYPFPENPVLSPPRNLVELESAHQRSFSLTTCSAAQIPSKPSVTEEPKVVADGVEENRELNGFLKRQRVEIGKILNGQISSKAKIVLSGHTNSTSSMVAAICYTWLLEKTKSTNKQGVKGDDSVEAVVVPVMNMTREKMLKQRQVAWLFHHVGLDATALLFSDEVDLETLMMAKKLSILVVGEDILKTKGEVRSQCTILTDNYREDAYDLLQTPMLKNLLIAGILLDTQNLKMSAKLTATRDAEAVQLLTVSSHSDYRNTFYDQLMQDQKGDSFFEALRHNYGKPPDEGGRNSGAPMPDRIQEKKSNRASASPVPDKKSNDVKSTTKVTPPKPAKAPVTAPKQAADPARGKNKFFLAKWFGLGPK